MRNGKLPRLIAFLILSGILLLTLIPFGLLFYLSAKDNLDILVNFWGIPKQIKWENYLNAFEAVNASIGNSLFVCAAGVTGTLILASLSAYVLARHSFPGKTYIYLFILGIMMIPGILTIVPLYSVIVHLELDQTFWGLILPYIAGSQILGILLCRTFFEEIPEELFEAARMDGGSEFYLYSRIALPLSLPILVTVGLITFISIYNDYIWPLLVLSPDQNTFMVAAVNLTSGGRQDIGLTFAAYVLGSIPTLFLFAFGMKYYINGMISGAVKN